jgi:drug/metabolite transporter (DMT)-like permease
VLAVICCAAAPLAFALAGALTAGAILGASAGLGALTILGGVALAIRHRRRARQLRSSTGRRS